MADAAAQAVAPLRAALAALPLSGAGADADEVFSRRLRDWRTIAGLTQRQLAERMDLAGHKMHQTTVAKIEAGERAASIGEAATFARILGVDLADLVTEPGSDASGELAKALVEREDAARDLRELGELAQRLDREYHDAVRKGELANERLQKAMAKVESLRVQEGK